MNFQKRTIAALVLCAVIWIVFDFFFLPKEPPPDPEGDASAQLEGKDTPEGKEGKQGEDTKATKADPKRPDRPEPPDRPAQSDVPVGKHELGNELLALTLTNRAPGRDGVIEGITLRSQQFAGHQTETDAFLLAGARTLEVSFADELTEFRIPAEATFEVGKATSNAYEVSYADDDVEVVERLELLEGYEAKLTVWVTNRTKAAQRHRMHLRTFVGAGEGSRYDVRRGVCRVGEDLEYEDSGDVEDGPLRFAGSVKWGGVDSKYFGQLIVPTEPFAACEISASEDQTLVINKMSTGEITVEPGETHEHVMGLYIGPKELERLGAFSAVSALPEGELQSAIDWGFFGSVSEALGRILLTMMRFFHGLVGVWGWAIVLLTFTIKVMTLPLTLKQMSSMKRMKEIQPEIAKIKEKYGDDRVKQGQEMQALFSRSGVNPLAGCLPMLVQLPIWFALYSMLGAAVELVHEPFLWLPDLTKQDPYYALPLALGAMMILQNRMMPSAGDEAQQKMMRWLMPIMFTVFMLFLPSGLGVYIFVNIVLSVIQTAIQVGTKANAPAKAAS